MLNSIKTQDVRDLLREAVAIDSVNHNFSENRAGESDLCDWVELVLQKREISYQSQTVRNRQRNLVAVVPGRSSERAICFEAHLDTTTARGMSVHPFGAEEIDGAVYGRGTCDGKGPLAAMLAALGALVDFDEPPPQDVLFAATVDKEVGLTGIQRVLASDVRPALAVVGAPTNLGVARACRGCLRWRIAVGESPQSYTPSHRNAILDAVEVTRLLGQHFGQAVASHEHPLLGRAEVHPSRIRATSLEGFLPAHCAVDFEAYTVPGFDSDGILEGVQDVVGNIEAQEPPLKIAIEPPSTNEPPVETSESSPGAKAAVNACRTVLDSARVVGYPDCGHANRFAAAGIDVIAFGPGDPAQIRDENEHIALDQLAPAAMVYLTLMRTALG